MLLGVKERQPISEKLIRTSKSLMRFQYTDGKHGQYLRLIEKFKTKMPLYFTVNPLLICKIRIAIKVSRLNALT